MAETHIEDNMHIDGRDDNAGAKLIQLAGSRSCDS